MVTSKQIQGGTGGSTQAARPKRRGSAGASFLFFMFLLVAGSLALGGLTLFVPARLALVQEQMIGLLHGGIADTNEETFVDGCVSVDNADGPRAVTRTRRYTTFRDGTTLEVVFSGQPALTNACP